MKKTVTKFIVFYALTITILIFLLFLIVHYIIALTAPSLFGQITITLVASIVGAAILTLGLTIFDPVLIDAITIAHRMHRFENLSNPLLVKLSSQAPGTYHHSINVSNIAQKAARAIGADSLLVRTAAYYHDIGKLKNPSIFTENQTDKERNNSEEQDLYKYSSEIISHVEEGIKIARKYRLPEEIIDLIAQHHGTTKTGYFYSKAKENGIKINRKDFRYPGPNPLSKEAAILMIADAAEATTRSLQNHSYEDINRVIEMTIKDKISEGQLKKANLSENEIRLISDSISQTLTSIYHQRIEYKNDKS